MGRGKPRYYEHVHNLLASKVCTTCGRTLGEKSYNYHIIIVVVVVTPHSLLSHEADRKNHLTITIKGNSTTKQNENGGKNV